MNSQINLYGFWNEQAFLTKSGDLGIILRVHGVDYESLDQTAQDYAVKRLEAALKTFGPGFHVYQYLFKTNRPEIPFLLYDNPIVQAAVNQRKEFFREKLDQLFEVEIFYAIVIEGTRSKTGIAAALSRLPQDPRAGLQELKAQFSNDKLKILLREQIEADRLKLEQRVHSFVRQLSDLVQIEVLRKMILSASSDGSSTMTDGASRAHPRAPSFSTTRSQIRTLRRTAIICASAITTSAF